MSTHPIVHRPHKSLAEGAICFGCTAAILFAAAVALQWLLGFVP
jgi:hypothetical protein